MFSPSFCRLRRRSSASRLSLALRPQPCSRASCSFSSSGRSRAATGSRSKGSPHSLSIGSMSSQPFAIRPTGVSSSSPTRFCSRRSSRSTAAQRPTRSRARSSWRPQPPRPQSASSQPACKSSWRLTRRRGGTRALSCTGSTL
eukprot:Amastigsp_a509315_3.p3 type:complete len:143 gc:universal Amastigsp_a509315_3:161-589(+)